MRVPLEEFNIFLEGGGMVGGECDGVVAMVEEMGYPSVPLLSSTAIFFSTGQSFLVNRVMHPFTCVLLLCVPQSSLTAFKSLFSPQWDSITLKVVPAPTEIS